MLKETLKQLISTYGVDDVVRELHNQLKDHVQVGSGVWETDDGKNHMAVICINSGDNIEHTIGEFIEKSLGVIVLEPNRDNDDALHKAVLYINKELGVTP